MIVEAAGAQLESGSNVQKVVERVLGTEEEARARIERARKKAAGMRSSADEAYAASAASARTRAQTETRCLLDEARSEAESAVEREREAQRVRAEELERSAMMSRESILKGMVAVLCGSSGL